MGKTIQLEVAAPDRLLFEGEVESLQIPAADGYFGVLPGHAPMLAELGAGTLSFRLGDATRYMAVHDGVAEVLPDKVRVVTSYGVWASEVDVEREKVELDRATDLFHEHDHEADVEKAQKAVERARAQLDAYERSR